MASEQSCKVDHLVVDSGPLIRNIEFKVLNLQLTKFVQFSHDILRRRIGPIFDSISNLIQLLACHRSTCGACMHSS